MGIKFSGSHRRLHTPSDTFTNFHRWIHMSNQEYRVFHPRGYLSLLAILNTCIFHFLFLLCDRETHFGRYPILSSPPSNTKNSVDLPCTHDIPSNTKQSVDFYHALTPMSCDVPCINAMHVISCYMYNEHYMKQFITRTLCQVPWIIISKAYNLHQFMLIYITPIYQYIYNIFSML